MAFCASCGAPVEGRFCGKCGASVGAEAPAAPAPGAYAPAAQAAGLSEGAASALCYVLFAGVFFLAIDPYNRNRNIKFHAFQGLFFFGAAIVISIFLSILFAASVFGFGMWSVMLGIRWLVRLALFFIWLYVIIQASQGKRVMLPFIGPLAEQQANK